MPSRGRSRRPRRSAQRSTSCTSTRPRCWWKSRGTATATWSSARATSTGPNWSRATKSIPITCCATTGSSFRSPRSKSCRYRWASRRSGANASRKRRRGERKRPACPGGGRGMTKRRRWRNEVGIPDSSPSGDYREGPDHQGEREHARVPGGQAGDQDRNQGGRAVDLQGEGRFGAHGQLPGKTAAPRAFRGLPSGLEKGVRAPEGRREDAGVRTKFVVASHQFRKDGDRRKLTADD